MKRNRIRANSLVTFLLIMLLNPLAATIISVIEALKNNKYTSLLLFAIMVALYASVINITKVPVHDQANYLWQFNNVDKVGFIQTLMFGGAGSIKEPIYGIYVYISYYLFMGNAKLFFLQTSFLILFFHYMAMINIARKYKYPNYIVITGIIMLTCFVPFYGLTLHLVRQELATGIALYAISLKALDDKMYKRYIPYMFLAIFIHSTSILLILLSFIPGINKELRLKRLPYFILLITIVTFTFPKISQSLLGDGDSNFMTYALSRATTADGLTDTAGVRSNSFILYLVSTPLIFFSIHSYYIRRKNFPPILVNFCLMMCLFVCLVSYSPVIQYRYFFALYSLIMFIPIFVFKISSINSKIFCLIISILMITYFLTCYGKNYDYAELAEIICYPYSLFFSINPY